MRTVILNLVVLIVGCSVNYSAKKTDLRNQNVVISDQNLKGQNGNVQSGNSRRVDCGAQYRLILVDNPSRADPEHEGDFIPKDVNILVDHSVVGKIEVPSISVKNFSLNSMNKTENGFLIEADWGGWQNHYELKYYFVCRDRNFFFSRLKVHRIIGKDPGDPKNWEKIDSKIEPNIPIEQFSIMNYLGSD